MAKKIKFPLEMKNGVMVRTIDELRENFDAEKLVTYYLNGKLKTWLDDRHYDEYSREISENVDPQSVLNSLCAILIIDVSNQIECIDINDIKKKNQKVAEVKAYTDKKEILQNINLVAMNQEEFNLMINQGEKIIYLLGEKFVCTGDIQNITIEGINNPIIEIKTQELVDFDTRKVRFRNVTFDKKFQALLDKKLYEDEHKNDKKRKHYIPSKALDFRMSDKDKEQSKHLYNILQDQLVETVYDIDVNTKKIEKILLEANLDGCFSIDNFGKQQKYLLSCAELDNVFYEFSNKISR